ncbi:MAG: thioredoxin family protein [Halanaerobiales bacterium]
MNGIQETKDNNFQELINKNNFVLVIFSSINCGYCKIAKKNLLSILEQISGLAVYEYIIDSNSVIMEKYNVTSVPLMILFDKGEAVHRFFGVRQKEDLYYQLKAYLPADMTGQNKYDQWPDQ